MDHRVQTGIGCLGCADFQRLKTSSFFSALKTECLHHYKFKTRDQAKQVVFEYIEVFYKRIRRYATIQNQVPADYAYEFYKNELQIAA